MAISNVKFLGESLKKAYSSPFAETISAVAHGRPIGSLQKYRIFITADKDRHGKETPLHHKPVTNAIIVFDTVARLEDADMEC